MSTNICPRIAHFLFVLVTILVFFLRFVISSVFGCLRNFIFEFCFSKVNIYVRKKYLFQVGFTTETRSNSLGTPRVGVQVYSLQISFFSCITSSLFFLFLGHVISITEIHQQHLGSG